MKFIGKIIFYPIAAVVVVFAVVNRGPVTLSLWPFPFEITVPVFVALLAAVAVGVVLGGVASRLGAMRREHRARKANPPKFPEQRVPPAPPPTSGVATGAQLAVVPRARRVV